MRRLSNVGRKGWLHQASGRGYSRKYVRLPVIKLNATKSIEYPSGKVTFEVIELPLLRELMYVKLSIVPCVLHLRCSNHPLAETKDNSWPVMKILVLVKKWSG